MGCPHCAVREPLPLRAGDLLKHQRALPVHAQSARVVATSCTSLRHRPPDASRRDADQPWPRERGVLVLPRPTSHPCMPLPSPGPNVAPPAFFVASVLFRAVRFAFFATDLAPARAPAFWSLVLDAFATRLVPPERSEPPRAFWRLVPPPRLFPVLPPREFEPTLLLGVALGITVFRFRQASCVQISRSQPPIPLHGMARRLVRGANERHNASPRGIARLPPSWRRPSPKVYWAANDAGETADLLSACQCSGNVCRICSSAVFQL